MEKIETNLKDCYILKPNVFEDNRGYFKAIIVSELEELGFKDLVQINESKSNKGTIRGLHFQKNPYSQAKVVRCINGKVQHI